MKQLNRIFRIFVSSTFSDMQEERNALQKRVFPKLRELCMQNGCRFQAIDLRWGVREEAALDHQTMKICLDEIGRCQITTPRPNFIVLLGDRYGWRPLPADIPADEFTKISHQFAKPKIQKLLKEWYKRDNNAVPPVFTLRPREGEFIDNKKWNTVESQLRAIFDQAAGKMNLTGDTRSKYTGSATEQEIIHGAMSVSDAHEHVFCFFRSIKNLPFDRKTEDFVDLDKDGKPDFLMREYQDKLKTRLDELLPGNVCKYDARWTGKDYTTEHIDQFCDDVLKQLTKIIKSEIEQLEESDALDMEIDNHKLFGKELARFFTGRKKTLGKINKYLKSSTGQPFVIFGASGSGKTALMAEAVKQSAANYKNAEIAQRFIGVTPDSSDIRSLLESLCRQISRIYGSDEATVPAEYKQLEKEFPKRLSLATAEKPLILFLDALDQLSDAKNARDLLWLPRELPENVFIIVSTLTDDCLAKLKLKLQDKNLFELEPMQDKEGRNLLNKWLKDAERTLNTQQKNYILENFKNNKLPLYLKLAFEEARQWKSYSDKKQLSPDIPGIIQDMLFRLSLDVNHGKVIVSRSLGYLAAARNGLTEDEMIDMLSRDKQVLQDFTKRSHHKPPEERLPVIIWSRLHFDLEPYLTERSGDGTTLMSFYHRQLSEVVAQIYLTGKSKKQRHRALSNYFKIQPLQSEEKGLESPNLRKLTELPYQQTFGERWKDLEKTLTDFSFAMAKSAADRVDELDEDYQSALSEISEPSEKLKFWEKFWRIKKHLLLRGSKQWPAYKILLQIAWEYSAKSPVTKAAEKWISEERCDWHWIRIKKNFRPDKMRKDACIRVLEGHSNGVQFVTLVPGRDLAVTGCEDGTMRLWKLINGRCLRIYEGHTDSIRSCCITPDGSKIISASHDCTVRVWDIETPVCQGILNGHRDWVLKVAMSPKGDAVISSSKDGTVRMWDINSLKCIRVFEGHNTEVTSVAWFPDARRIVSSSAKPDNSLYVWDARSGKCLKKFTGHISAIRNIRISMSGKMIASASHDQTVRVWDSETGECLQVLGEIYPSMKGHTEWVRDVTFTPDERRIISVSNDKTVRLWDVQSGKCLKVFEGHAGSIMGVAVAPDGKTAITAATRPDNSVRIWDLDAPLVSDRPVGHLGRIKSMTISPDGNLAAIGSGHPEKDARVWDLKTGKCKLHLKKHGGWVTSLAFSPDGKILVSGSRDGGLRQWSIPSGKCLNVIKGHENRITVIKFSVDGEKILSSGWDEQIVVSSSKTGEKLYVFGGLTDWADCIYCDKKGRLAAAGLRDGKILIWDIEDRKKRRTVDAHQSAIVSVVFSPRINSLYSLSQNGNIRSWNSNTGKFIADHEQNTLYKEDPEIFSLMASTIRNKSFLPVPSKIGLGLNSTAPIHWCCDQVTAIFLNNSMAVLEKIGTVNTIRLLDIMHGARKIGLEEMETGNLLYSFKFSPSSRLNREIIMHAYILLGWIFEGIDDRNNPLILDIQRYFALSYEDRDDILKHVKLAGEKKEWNKRTEKLISRSIKRVKQGLQNGLLPAEGPLAQSIQNFVNIAETDIKL